MDIIERLRFDAARCEQQFSKGVAGNIEEAAAEIARLRAALAIARPYMGPANLGHGRDLVHDRKIVDDTLEQSENTNG